MSMDAKKILNNRIADYKVSLRDMEREQQILATSIPLMRSVISDMDDVLKAFADEVDQ